MEIVDQNLPWERTWTWSSPSRRRQNGGPRLTFWPKRRVAWFSRRRRDVAAYLKEEKESWAHDSPKSEDSGGGGDQHHSQSGREPCQTTGSMSTARPYLPGTIAGIQALFTRRLESLCTFLSPNPPKEGVGLAS